MTINRDKKKENDSINKMVIRSSVTKNLSSKSFDSINNN